jgi:SAM-dependent methyltransferase
MKHTKLKKNSLPPAPVVPIRLDLGSGPGKKPNFIGVDQTAFPGVDVVLDLRKPWPWKDNSVEEVHSSHFIEHLWNTPDRPERVHFVNELWRVLKPGAKATIIAPYWSSGRAYGDFTHCYPPVAAFWFFYLKKDWREVNAPHDDIKWNPLGYTCNFECTWGFALHPEVANRNQEYQQYAMQFLIEATPDVIATLTKV